MAAINPTILDPRTFDDEFVGHRYVWADISQRLRDGEFLVIARNKLPTFLESLHRHSQAITLICAVSGDEVTISSDTDATT